MKWFIFVALLFATPAFAQQQQRSPSQIAIEANQMVGYLASFAEQEGVTIQQLQKQLADAQARVKELEGKYETSKPKDDAH
jgi:TolA-binding protein